MLNINNTLESYLQNVEIKGNTIQNPNNLSDIKSVGDKIDDQEVYRIPIVCTNGLDKSSSDYKEHKITILSPVQLEKVGDVTDRIIEKDGVWGVEKNIVEGILDSNVAWSGILNIDGYTSGWRANNYSLVMCNKLKQLTSNEWESKIVKGLYSSASSANMGIVIPSSELSSENSSGLNEWVKNNKPIVKFVTKQPQFIPLPHAQQVKLRTFANKTNISFLTEIEGTIKADVAKSINASVKSNTQEIGKINNRILDLEGLKESQEMSYETDKGYLVCKETRVGAVKDMKIYGKSLANIFKISQSDKNDTKLFYECDRNIGTTFKGINVTLFNPTSKKVIFDIRSSNTGYWLRSVIMNANELSKYVTLTDDEYIGYIYGQVVDGWVSSNEELQKLKGCCVVIIGDHTQNPPSYFEGIASVGTGVDKIEVSSYGKNLLDISRPIIDEKNRYGYFELPKTNNNVTISLKDKDSSLPLGNAYLGLTKTGVDAGNGNEITWIISNGELTNSYPKNYNYVSFFPNNMETLNLILKRFDIMVNLGDIAIPYEPYKGDKKPLLFKDSDGTWKPISELRGLDTVCDTIELHNDGKYYYHQRTGKTVLNGSEQYISHQQTDNYISFILNNPQGLFARNQIVLCDKFIGCIWDSANKEMIWSYIESCGICISKSKLETQDVEGFKKWLQANNVTVIYQLAEEKVFEVNSLFLEAYENETMILCESGAVKPGIEWKITSYITNLVSTNTKRIKRIENDFYNYTVSQNRMMLSSRYNADRADFRIDNTLGVPKTVSVELDYDLFELMKKVVIVGKDNYDRSKIEEQMDFYVTEGFIDWDMWDELFAIIELQHNPPVDLIPIEPISIEEPKPKKSRRGRKKKVEEI